MNEERKTSYSDEELKYFRSLILQKKQEAEKEIDMLQGQVARDNRDELDNDSGYSFHIADSAAVATGRENVYIMIDRQQKLINYLDRALDRIENSKRTFGSHTAYRAFHRRQNDGTTGLSKIAYFQNPYVLELFFRVYLA